MGLILASGATKPQYPYDQWYGIQGDFLSADYQFERVGNLDLHRTLPVQKKLRRFVENPDGSVKYYLNQNDSRLKTGGTSAIIDSSDGNVMYEKPEYYMKVEIEGTKWVRAYSEYPLPGFIKMGRKTCSPWGATIDQLAAKAVSGCFLQWNGDEIARDENGIVKLTDNAANCRGGNNDSGKDGTYNSQLGMCRTSQSKDWFRNYCLNGTHLGFYRIYNEIAWLQRCEYASFYCQDTYTETLTDSGFRQGGLGAGCSVSGSEWNDWGGYLPFVPCGVTATLGNNTGKVPYVIKGWTGGDKTVQVTSYRGLEVPFEYIWWMADDVLIYHSPDSKLSKSTAYLCEDPSKFISPADMDTEIPEGYKSITDIPRTSGYVLKESQSEKGCSFPVTTGGSANSGLTDYFYHPGGSAEGWFGALFGGTADTGATAGFGYLTTYNRSSLASAYLGFRLCRS